MVYAQGHTGAGNACAYQKIALRAQPDSEDRQDQPQFIESGNHRREDKHEVQNQRPKLDYLPG